VSRKTKWGQIVAVNIHLGLEKQIRNLYTNYRGTRFSACGVWDIDTVLLRSKHKVVATAFFDEVIQESGREIYFALKLKKIRRLQIWKRYFQCIEPGEVIVAFFTGGHAT